MRRRFDRDRDYATVHGMPGIAFCQDGHMFAGNGQWVEGPEDDSAAASSTDRANPGSGDPVPVTPTVHAAASEDISEDLPIAKDDMRLKENKALKVQMEAYGEPWRGVAHARQFLGIG